MCGTCRIRNRVVVTPGSKLAAVEGVVHEGEKPASGAMVMLIPQPYVADSPLFARKFSGTDQYGRFSIKGIAPGEYRLYALETFIPINELDPEQVKLLDKFAVTLKLREEAREQVEAKIARLKVE